MRTIIILLSVFLLNSIILKAQYSPPIAVEFQITSSSAYETTPALGNDGNTDLVVFTAQAYDPIHDRPGSGDIWYQRLVNGSPFDTPVQVSRASTDDELNDTWGDYIVYSACDYVGSGSGTVMVYEISTATSYSIRYAEMIAEVRIHDRVIVWREGGTSSSQIMYYDLDWIGTDLYPVRIAGPDPPAFDVQIGDRFVVWTELREGQYDVCVRDLDDASFYYLTNTPLIDETEPSTNGSWVVWSAQEHGLTSSSIMAMNLDNWETQVIVDNGARNFYPNISGNLIVWDSDLNGNYDVFAHELTSGEIFQVTSDPDNQYINNVFNDLVAYTDTRNGHNDIYISHLSFFISIPDTNFEQALIDLGIDSDGTINHLILDRDAEAVTELDVSNPEYNENLPNVSGKIVDLKGIEAFINLTSLNCSSNELRSLNISNSKDLVYLNCSYNQLSYLNVSKNTVLEQLYCSNNQLTNLSTYWNTALSYLSCWYNPNLTILNISNNILLAHLDCTWCGLTNLDVSNNINLTFLWCEDNHLTSLDVSNNSALVRLNCALNWFSLIGLDVSNNAALQYFDCWGCGLTSLDISNNTALRELNCGNNQLISLDVSNNISLSWLYCIMNQLESLDVSKNIYLRQLDLRYMPTLYEVCVWESFPAGINVDTTSSPNVDFTTDCAVNALNVYKEISKINIYPNPSDDIINIEIENPNNVTLEIYNVSGRLVFSRVFNSQVEKINVTGLSAGIYFVKVRQENNVRIEKLIVY